VHAVLEWRRLVVMQSDQGRPNQPVEWLKSPPSLASQAGEPVVNQVHAHLAGSHATAWTTKKQPDVQEFEEIAEIAHPVIPIVHLGRYLHHS
jgi:hypothetical protein